MADNVTVDNGALTDYIVSDEELTDTSHLQSVELHSESAGTKTKFGTNANPIRVNPTGVTTQPVSGSVSVSGTVTVDTELPAAVALADNMGNPTVPQVGAHLLGFDGTLWDRILATSGSLSVDIARVFGLATGHVPIGDGTFAAEMIGSGVDNLGNTVNELVTAALGYVFDGTAWDRLRGDSVGGAFVQGPVASDVAVAGNPLLGGGRASDAVPTAVSTDGDAVAAWLDRRGAAKVVMVDDAGDSAMDGANNALRVNVVAGSGAGVTHTDKAAFTVSSDDGVPVFGMLDDTSPSTLAEGEAGVIRATANRALHVNLRDASGSELAVGGGTQYDEDTASAAAEKITMAGVVRKDTAASLVDTDADRTELQVDATGRLWTNTELADAAALSDTFANPTTAPVGAFVMGYNGSTWERISGSGGSLEVQGPVAADAPAAGNPLYVGGRASAAAPADVSLDGDVVPHWHLRNGAGAVVVTAAGALIGGDATNGLDVDVTRVSGTVTVDTELPAAVALADNAGNPTAPAVGAFAMGWDGTNWDRIRAPGGVVEISAPSPITVAQGAAGTAWEVVGDVAHDVAAPANPVVVGGQMETMADSAPGTRAGTDGDATKLATLDGAIYQAGRGPQSWQTSFRSTSTLQTDGSVHAAPGAGLSLYVTDIIFSIGAATASSVFFEEGAATVIGPFYLEAIAGRGMALHFQTPFKVTANTALTVTNTGSVTYSIHVLGFIGPG